MTAPFGEALASALREPKQGGKLYLLKGTVFNPQFYCCISGASMGVNKDPVARLSLSVTQVCAGDPVTADYSRSWSPTSTINNWSVSWGDGNVSNGAWPGAGSVAHPLGGYVWPGTYTVTLTVTDLLGATHRDTVQIVVLDCTVCDIEMMGGCGASGMWYSLTGGISWEDISDSLEGVEVYDLKVSLFDSGYMWAATAEGLYRDTLDMQGWERVTLPDPAGGNEEPVAYAVLPSNVLSYEVYILALKASTNEVYVFRAVSARGTDWTWQKVGTPNLAVSEQAIGFASTIPDFVHLDNVLYALEVGIQRLWVRDPVAQTWAIVPGYPGGHTIRRIITGMDGNNIWGAGGDGVNKVLYRYNTTTGWNTFVGGALVAGYDSITQLADGRLCCGTGSGMTVDLFSTNGAFLGSTAAIGGVDPIRDITHEGGTLLAATWLGGTANVYRWTGLAWVLELTAATTGVNGFLNYDGAAYISVSVAPYVRRREGILWVADEGQPANSVWLSKAYDEEQDEYTLLGTSGAYAYVRDDNLGWRVKYNIPPTAGQFVNYDNGDYIYSLPGIALRRVDFGNGIIPTVGRYHLMSMSSDGAFLYAALLNIANQPIVFRFEYDLPPGPDLIHNPLAGTWGGVMADPSYSDRLWIFGDFGAASKLLLSEGWGDAFVDVTDGGWGANEVVRPVMPSLMDPDDVIAILNTALESWRSLDGATTWLKTGDTAFACGCGVRDYFDPLNIFIGHAGPAPTGANHIQYSPNAGVGWIERSTGFEADAPVPSLEIVS